MMNPRHLAFSLVSGTLLLGGAMPGRPTPTEVESNGKIARRVFDEIFNQGKFEVANEIYASDFVNHGVTRDVDLKEDQEAAVGWRIVAPDLKMTVNQTIAAGDRVVVLWTGRGTNTGSANGIPATGKTVTVRGITIWRITNGRIEEEWSEFDRLGMFRQLGLLPDPALASGR